MGVLRHALPRLEAKHDSSAGIPDVNLFRDKILLRKLQFFEQMNGVHTPSNEISHE